MVPRAILYHQQNHGLRVLDPFMGSGTTAVETVLSGNIPYGLEMDHFARLISEVSSTVFTEEQLAEINRYYEVVAATWRDFEPSLVPELDGIGRWFNPGDLDLLLRLKACILATVPSPYKDFFLVVFADCIKPVS